MKVHDIHNTDKVIDGLQKDTWTDTTPCGNCKCEHCTDCVKGERNRLIAMAREEGIQQERKAWLNHERCEECGKENTNELSSMCSYCLENA